MGRGTSSPHYEERARLRGRITDPKKIYACREGHVSGIHKSQHSLLAEYIAAGKTSEKEKRVFQKEKIT